MSGREKTDTVQIRLDRETVQMVDDAVRQEIVMERQLAGKYDEPTEQQIAERRRTYLRDLLGEVVKPTDIVLRVSGVGNYEELQEVVNWMTAEKERLRREAPKAVQDILKLREAWRALHDTREAEKGSSARKEQLP